VAIKTKKSFNNLIKSLVEEIIEEEDLDEITTTGSVAGYMTPNAFTGGGPSKETKKKRKKNSSNRKKNKVNEALDKKDLEIIRKLIRDVVGDIYRDIWIKRNSWK
tara:strand:- start:536 stop:850 length:315 start_codon:yes stop_codon:yes gene_type:complete